MNLIMSAVDYSMAGLHIREKISLTNSMQIDIYEKLRENPDILGVVIVSTCNRTELYLSLVDGVVISPLELLCEVIGVEYESYKLIHKTRSGQEVLTHLCALSCGIKSQIWGEDQIITQVKKSLNFARENKATDSILEVLFRKAISAAKKIKTDVKLTLKDNSVALKSLNIIKNNHKDVKKILVIGNGEVGRLVSETMIKNGYDVTITLRAYKYHTAIIPEGVGKIEYSKRYEALCQFDAVISATLSPHLTVEKDKIDTRCPFPQVYIDLAVPRDIDYKIAEIENVRVYDIDSVGKEEKDEIHENQVEEIDVIIEKYVKEFNHWCAYRKQVQGKLECEA